MKLLRWTWNVGLAGVALLAALVLALCMALEVSDA